MQCIDESGVRTDQVRVLLQISNAANKKVSRVMDKQGFSCNRLSVQSIYSIEYAVSAWLIQYAYVLG